MQCLLYLCVGESKWHSPSVDVHERGASDDDTTNQRIIKQYRERLWRRMGKRRHSF